LPTTRSTNNWISVPISIIFKINFFNIYFDTSTIKYFRSALKKVTAIFFVLLFAFNWFGYRSYYDYLQHKTNEHLDTMLDNNSYDESQLVELKIPVSVPYQTS